MMKSCGPVGMISHTSVRVISFTARASRSGHRVATLVRVVCEFPFSVEGAPTNGTAPVMESNYVRRVRRHLRRSCRRPDDLEFRRRRPVAGPSRCSPGNNDGNHAGRRGGVVCAAPILRTAASRPDLASGDSGIRINRLTIGPGEREGAVSFVLTVSVICSAMDGKRVRRNNICAGIRRKPRCLPTLAP